MVPLRLRLRNFMCYREDNPELNLTGVHLACLAGDNGAGKSTLLAAMTWALWGKARDRVNDDELITQGATEMEVDFEFALGEHRYRVLRKRNKKHRGQTLLNFEVYNDGAWKAITGHTVPETERKIIETLRLDYETFVNSAFLLQGRADSFTMKSPTERKELLGEILSLGVYDHYLDAARQRSRQAEAERNRLQGVLAQLDQQIARKPLVQADLAQRTQEHEAAQAALAEQEAAYTALTTLLQRLEAQEQELTAVRQRIGRDEADVARLRREVESRQGRISAYEAILAERTAITTGYTRLQAAHEQEARLSAALAEVRQLEKEAASLQRAIDDARNQLVNAASVHQRMIADLDRRAAGQAALEMQLAEARRELAGFAEIEQRREATLQRLSEAQQQAAGLEGENKKLKEEMEELRGKLNMLDRAREDATWQHGGQTHGTACPLCGLLLDDDAYARVRASYQDEGEARKKRYLANKRRGEELQQEITRWQRQVDTCDTQLKPRSMVQKRESTYERDLAAAVEATTRLADEQAQLAVVEAQLVAAQYATTERARLTVAERRIRELAFDQPAYDAVRREVQELAPFQDRHARLREAEANLEPERQALGSLEESLTSRTASLAGETDRAAVLQAALRDLPQKRDEGTVLRRQVERSRGAVVDAASLRTRAQHQLEDILAAEVERATQADAQQHAIAEKGVYDELVKAFGKGGIQAMIIESVIPELQDEANTLLSRMTDGRMHLAFETQRQAKTTDSVIETLDIRITDEVGTARKYELFSGGEAFRINFAVRIALSKLLARRAGAQLQTLVIDEGFGTQDGQGRERLIGAIRSIQDDFACILVITHIQELKDEFPTRIEVTRTAAGSHAVLA